AACAPGPPGPPHPPPAAPPAPRAAPAAAPAAAAAAPAASSSDSSASSAAAVVPAAALAAAAPSQNKPMRTVTVSGDAFFDTNKATFRKEAQPELEKISARVRNVTSVEAIQITGFTDNTGTAEYNQKLAEARASTVKDFLVKNGIDPSKITILGKGAADPVADNSTKEGRAKNRRVEVMVKGEVAGQ